MQIPPGDLCSLGFFQSFQAVPSEMLARAGVCSDGKRLLPLIPFSQETALAIPVHSRQGMTPRSHLSSSSGWNGFPREKQDEDVELMVRNLVLAGILAGANRKTRNDPIPLC